MFFQRTKFLNWYLNLETNPVPLGSQNPADLGWLLFSLRAPAALCAGGMRSVRAVFGSGLAHS